MNINVKNLAMKSKSLRTTTAHATKFNFRSCSVLASPCGTLSSMGSFASGFEKTSKKGNVQTQTPYYQSQQKRHLNVHEYSSMQIFKDHGVNVPKGVVVSSPDEAVKAFEDPAQGFSKSGGAVLKAQVLAGGRGRGHFTNGFNGGVHVVKTPDEAREYASKMIGSSLVTKQTGPEGKPCHRVYLMELLDVKRETYFSILMDRTHGGPSLVGSPKGGMSIEDVAKETPELIFKEEIDIMEGVTDQAAERLAKNLGFSDEGTARQEAKEVIKKLYQCFIDTDATLIEINPLAETGDGHVFVADAKLNFDDNAEFRQPKIFEQRDRSQEDPREVEASKYDLNYIGLQGDIGCLVNGAGLAMAVLDLITLHGGSASNFLDVGGSATEDQIEKSFTLINADKDVKAIFVCIFGGIMRCDVIAKGVVSAARNIGLEKPVVVRLQGTMVEEAKEIIKAATDVKVIQVDDLDEAAAQAVKIARE